MQQRFCTVPVGAWARLACARRTDINPCPGASLRFRTSAARGGLMNQSSGVQAGTTRGSGRPARTQLQAVSVRVELVQLPRMNPAAARARR